ncbi:MAG: flagellar biosynthetic protein FliR [Thermodesulfobacteriota bacterium]
MPDSFLLNWTVERLLILTVIMVRVGTLLFLMPVLGSRGVPSQVKALFTAVTALALVGVVPVSARDLPAGAAGCLLLVLSELTFGAILALFARLVFAAVETGGQMVGVQMGMGMAGVMDPQFGTQISQVGQFWNLTAILLFLAVDGHHLFLATMAESFAWVPPGGLTLSEATFRGMMAGVSRMFVLAIKIMAPVSAVLFFSQVALGILAKTVPQINLLIVSLPLNIALGFIFVGLSLGLFAPLLLKEITTLERLLPRLAQGLGG